MTHSTHFYRLWRRTFSKGNTQTTWSHGFGYLTTHSTDSYLRLWCRTFGKGNTQTTGQMGLVT